MKPTLTRQQADSYGFMEILNLTAFRPDLRDHAYPLEKRLKQHRIKELAVLSGDGAAIAVHLLTRTRKGTWTASELSGVNEIGTRAVAGVFAPPDVPAVLRISQKSDALLANILAVSPRKAMVEGVSDDTMRVQSVRLGADRHIVWRMLANSLQRFERPFPPDAPLVRVTHGLASVVRFALEKVSAAAATAPDAILCGDHRNFIWMETASGRISEAIRPREVSNEDELREWLEGISYEIPPEQNYRIELWVSPFCWMQVLPPTVAARLPQNLKFEVKPVSLADIVFS